MIKISQVSVANLGGSELYVPQQITPGWYYDSFYGYYYLFPDGSKYIGNPVTGQVFYPMAFVAEYEYSAASIRSDAPIEVFQGNSVKVDFKFNWKGEARTIWFRIGSCKKVLANYDEGDVVRVPVDVAASTDWKAYTGSGTFTYISGFATLENKHLFILPEGFEYDVVYTNAFDKVTEEWELIRDYVYPRASTYNGPAESCLFTFKLLPDQLPGHDWIKNKVIDAFASEMTKGGREMLEIKVWEDTSPLLWTNYKIFIVYTDPGGAATVQVFRPMVAHVGVIIAAVLIILFIVAITFLIKEINKLWYGTEEQPGLEEYLPLLLMVVMMSIIMPVPSEGTE